MSQEISCGSEPSKVTDPRVTMASDRTGMASFRTQLALDRTTLAWIRTTLALAGFGFGMVSQRKEKPSRLNLQSVYP